jgi:meso-butanediol dehydrogenase/(S,S)-butanediol dehydrogenase/diacetyl reductase
MGLEGTVVLVTGAGRGIGRQIALRLAGNGADVAVADVNADAVEETAQAVESLGRKSVALTVDLADPAAAEALPRRALDQLGRLDTLVNNAAIGDPRSLWELEPEHWDRVYQVNVKGTFFCLRGAARIMREAQGGKIVNLASSAGKLGSPNHLHYAATKAAVINITHSAASALAPYGINVNCVCPGIVETTLWDQAARVYAELSGKPIDEVVRERVAKTPLGRAAQPDDVAGVVAFLVSSDADYMTGQALNVTGGLVTF